MSLVRAFVVGGALPLMCAASASAVNIFFPASPPPPGTVTIPPYNPDEFTLTSSIFSANYNVDRVVVGYASDSTNSHPLPYPFRKPYETILNVPDTITIHPHTRLYAGSTINLLKGSAMARSVEIHDDSTLNVTEATVEGTVQVLHNGKVDLTNATMNSNVTGSATSTITVTDSTVLGQMTTGNSFSTSNSTFGSLTTTGSASVALNTGQVLRGATALDSSLLRLTEIDLTSSIAAHNFGVMYVVGGSAAGTVHANHFSTVTLTGGVEIGIDAYAHGGNLVLEDGTIAGAVRVESHPTAAGGDGAFLMSGGKVGGDLTVEQDASALVSGGTLARDAIVRDRGVLTVNGPDALVEGSLIAFNDGAAHLVAGKVSGNLAASFGGTVHCSGGAVTGSAFAGIGGSGTIVHSGGTIGGSTFAREGAHVFISDGSISGGLYAEGEASVLMSGGDIADTASFRNQATGTITGGNLDTIYASGSSTVNLHGGRVAGHLLASENATINMSGGVVHGDATANGNAVINYSGGIVFGTEQFTPRPLFAVASDSTSLPALIAYDDAVINIYGTGLVATLLNPDYEGGFSQYGFSGTLADGTVIAGATFLIANGGGATYALLPPVPEPAAVMLLALPALASLSGRRRRRRAA